MISICAIFPSKFILCVKVSLFWSSFALFVNLDLKVETSGPTLIMTTLARLTRSITDVVMALTTVVKEGSSTFWVLS